MVDDERDAVAGGDIRGFQALPAAQEVENEALAGIAYGCRLGQPSGLTVATVMIRCWVSSRRIVSLSWGVMVRRLRVP